MNAPNFSSMTGCHLCGGRVPDAGRDLVGAYVDAAPTAVTEMGEKVAKKLGDGLMALFGYHSLFGERNSAKLECARSVPPGEGGRQGVPKGGQTRIAHHPCHWSPTLDHLHAGGDASC
jgi:class 3 adenylate cyclase